MTVPGPPYPAAIDFDDIAAGMDIQTTITYPDTGSTSVTRGIVGATDDQAVRFTNGALSVTDHWLPLGATVTYQLMTAPGTLDPEPDSGSIVLDDTGAAWQRQGDGSAWQSINGDSTDWAGFLAAHPTYTLLQDTPPVVLPDPPPDGYPVTIGPGDARLGMDIRVTVTYAAGGSQVVRAECPWVQENPPPTDATPSFLIMPAISGPQLVADPDIQAMAASNPDYQAMMTSRLMIQYDPLPDGVTLLVEQMQDWTADSVWDISGIPEPPDGSVVRSRDGVAWQRTGTATEDGPVFQGNTAPYYFTGQGMWSSVLGDYPRSFLWLWGAAAPFALQETAP